MFTPDELCINARRKIILTTTKGIYEEEFLLDEIAKDRFALYSADSLNQAIEEAKIEFAPGIYQYGKNGLTDWYILRYMLLQLELISQDILSVQLLEN